MAKALKKPLLDIPFHRIKAYQLKCPDYRISLSPEELKSLWPNLRTRNIPVIPDFPLEVKSCLKRDEKYPIQALRQLYSYWEECNSQSIEGYGIIARVNLCVENGFINYYLFVPNKEFSMKLFRKIAFINLRNLKEKDISKEQRIIKAIGRLFY